MPTRNVEIKGLDELTAKIKSMTDLRVFDAGLRKGAVFLKAKVAKYPPGTSANVPNGHWYQRGYGPKWRVKSGDVHGRASSETLGRKWTMVKRGILTFIVGNNVSYGRFVQSDDDQASFHKRRGWPTIETVARLYSKQVLDLVKKNLDQALEK